LVTGLRPVGCGMGSDTFNTFCRSSANPSVTSFGVGLVRFAVLVAVEPVVLVREDATLLDPAVDLLAVVLVDLVVVVVAVIMGIKWIDESTC